MIPAGDNDGPKDWIEWLVDRAKDARIGIDARMLPHEKAVILNAQLAAKQSKLFYPPQNLVDLIWKEKPSRPREQIYVQPVRLAGQPSGMKIGELREWIKSQAPAVRPYVKRDATDAEKHVGTLVSNLGCIGMFMSDTVYLYESDYFSSIAWLLNLRGDDIPFNPVFHSYLFVSLTTAILFIEPAKVTPEIEHYLQSIGVDRRDYNEIWTFLRRKDWGEGKVKGVLISCDVY